MDKHVFTYNGTKIIIGESTFADVEELDIGGYERTQWGSFSHEYYFDQIGVSFTCRQNDSQKKIGWISIVPKKAKGEISDILSFKRNLKLKEVVEAFGEGKWAYTVDSTELDLDYQYFSIEMAMDKSFLESDLESFSSPNWEKYYDYYRNKKVKAIIFSKF